MYLLKRDVLAFCARVFAYCLWLEPSSASLASDLNAGGADPCRGCHLHPLHLLHVFSSPLPYHSSPWEFLLGELKLPPRQLPHPLGISSLDRSKTDLLSIVSLQRLNASHVALGLIVVWRRLWLPSVHWQVQVELCQGCWGLKCLVRDLCEGWWWRK